MNWLQFISSAFWPCVILVIFWKLRPAIIQLVARIRSARYKDWQLSADPLPTTPATVEVVQGIKTQAPANWFWLGNDIASISQAHILGAGRAHLNERYEQTLHHLREVGLSDSKPYRRLMQLFEFGKRDEVETWGEERRFLLAREIYSIARDVGNIVEASQKTFKGKPEQGELTPSTSPTISPKLI